MTTLVDHIVDLHMQIQSVKQRISASRRFGKVHQVDPSKRRLRVRIGGTDDDPVLSPWVPYTEIGAGPSGVNIAWNPQPGQNVVIDAAGGDLQQSVASPFTWSDNHASPSSAGTETVVKFGQSSARIQSEQILLQVGGSLVAMTPRGLVLSIGSVSMTLSENGVSFSAPSIKHDLKNIGKDHIHGGVVPGGATTDVPAN